MDTRLENNDGKQDKGQDLSGELGLKLGKKVEAGKLSQDVGARLDSLARKEAPEMVKSINGQFDDLLSFAKERTATVA